MREGTDGMEKDVPQHCANLVEQPSNALACLLANKKKKSRSLTSIKDGESSTLATVMTNDNDKWRF